MAAVFDLDTERHTRAGAGPAAAGVGDELDQVFDMVIARIGRLDPHQMLARARRYKAQCSALEIAATAELTKATGDDRATKKALDDGKTSKNAIAKAARRAAAAAANQDLINKAAANQLSEEQLDVIADTAAKTNGAAATNEGFIDQVAALNPDQAKAVAAKFVDDHTDPDGLQSEHDRQRRNRRATKYHSKKDGLDAITISGDGVSIKNMWG